MAHVSGPCSSMPGSVHRVPLGTMCDDHPDRLATKRIQGETDSFGAEFIDCCDECESRILDDKMSGTCDWCHTYAEELRPRRDFEEGISGPVYQVCCACVKKENDALTDELAY